jgi:hypothetical protein
MGLKIEFERNCVKNITWLDHEHKAWNGTASLI